MTRLQNMKRVLEASYGAKQMINLSTANIGDKFLTREGKSLTYIGKAYFFEQYGPDQYELYPTEMYNPNNSGKLATHISSYFSNGELACKEFAKTSAHPYDFSHKDLVKELDK